MNWHQQNISDILSLLNTSRNGLNNEVAKQRLSQYGKNILPQLHKVGIGKIILHQFTSPLIYVLLVAGGISLFIQEYKDAFFIFFIIFINGSIGAYQEWRAEKSALALREMMKSKANVIREGEKKSIDSSELVPGDIVWLESGIKVPADMRIIESHGLTVEEALLTGESLPVVKESEVIQGENVALGDRKNMLFAGTTVTRGRGLAVVVATGLQTEIGKIAHSIRNVGVQKVPLIDRMERFSKKISVAVLVATIAVILIGLIRGIALYEIFFVGIAMAVSAIPEGLPIAMTVALSISASRMARRNVIVRRLSAVEGLGSCTYIASDKTGTLTLDQQTVREIIFKDGIKAKVTGQGYNGEGKIEVEDKYEDKLMQIVEAVTICNEAVLKKEKNTWTYEGDAIDVALLALTYKAGITPGDIYQKVKIFAQIPFESENKYAATFYEKDNHKYIVAKGAIEVLVPYVSNELEKKYFLQKAEELAAKGYRVIAILKGKLINEEYKLHTDLSILGLIALIDPIKPEAKESIKKCQQAGIKVAMITGDHPTTALAIAQELGIAADKDEIISGVELSMLSKSELSEVVDKKRVFARVSPQQKMDIVEILQEKGNFVAVTGDGVNDAPALKIAHIGVAMGYGTDVAKEAASIIVTDNNFSSIAAGVEEGRYAYDNIRKIIYLLISTGLAEILMIILSLIVGLPVPFLAAQLLWLNLVTNGIQDISLAFEKGEKEVMNFPPRNPKESIFDKKMITQVVIAGISMTLVAFFVWYLCTKQFNYTKESARNLTLLAMVLLQNFHVFNCRSERKSIFKVPLSHNWILIAGVGIAQAVHIIAMHIPFLAEILHIHPVSIQEWVYVCLASMLVVIVSEVYKLISKK
ncbi:MAG: HAD-IC family P-type ATPase [Bacteroidia bacterium]|nr:HAD-IC family P-type ATPase [Bacteroidia bacterium]MDW8301320.1 HAD-IC family P-type ATPase [Bacteroidia bacterium]